MKFLNDARKRGLALFMALVMCLSLLPAQAMAEANPVGLTGDSREAAWEKLEATQIRDLLDAGTSTFTAGELAQKLSSTLTIDGRTVTNLGIGPEGNVADVTALSSEAQNVTYALGENGSVSATSDEQDQEPTTYTVTYTDGVEGEEVFADQKTENLASGVATPAFNGTPTREGYTFTGWLSGEIVYGSTAGNAFPSVTGDVTYVAQWTENTYTITWISDGNAVGSSTAKYGETPVYGGEPLSKDGFTFKCWAPEIAAATGDVTYTAVWEATTTEPTTYTVTYTDGVDGEEVFADQVNANLALNAETPAFNNGNAPTRDGYTFNGWNPVVVGTVTGNVTYTAQWIQNAGTMSTTPPASDPADMENSGGEDTQVAQVEALAASGAELDPQPVYLWARFKAETVDTGSEGVRITSIKVQNADNSGTATDMLTSDSFTVNYEKAVRLKVAALMDQSLPDKHIVIDIPADFKVLSYSQAAEEGDEINQIALADFTLTPLGAWHTYQPNSGKLDFTLKNKSNSVEVFVDIQPDTAIWSKGPTNTDAPENHLSDICGTIQVKASANNGQVYDERNFGAQIEGFGFLRCHLQNARSTVPKQAGKDFQTAVYYSSTSVDSSFYRELVVTIPKPKDGSGQYAKYRGWASKMDDVPQNQFTINWASTVDLETVIHETDNALIVTLKNVYAGNIYYAPIFYWEKDVADNPEGNSTVTIDPVTVKATFANGNTKEASCSARTLTAVDSELIEITVPDVYYNGRYPSRVLHSWYGSGKKSTTIEGGTCWDSDKLVYQLGQFFVWNNGVVPSTPKRLIIQYKNTDTVGVVRQSFPVPSGQTLTNVNYRTSVNGEWTPYTGEILYGNDRKVATVVLPDNDLQNGHYFTEIQADLEEGYPAYFTNNTVGGNRYPNAGCVTFGILKQAIQDDTTFEEFARLTIINLPEETTTPSENLTAEQGVSKSYSVVWGKAQGGRIRPEGGSLTKSKIAAGGEGTTVNGITLQSPEYPYTSSEVVWDPVIYVRLPEGIPITAWRFERMDKRTGNKIADLAENTDYTVTPTTADGYTVYRVEFRNYAGAGGWYLDKELNGNYVRFSFDLRANADAAGANLNLHECIFIQDRGMGDECADPIDWANAVADIYNIDGRDDTTIMATVGSHKLEVVAADEALLFYGSNGTSGDQAGTPAAHKVFLTENNKAVNIQFVAWNNTTRDVTYQDLRNNDFHFYIPVPQPGDESFADGTHMKVSAEQFGLRLSSPIEESDIFQVEYSRDAVRGNVDCYKGEAVAGAYQEATWETAAEIGSNWADVTMVRVRIKDTATGSIASGQKQTLDLTFLPVRKNPDTGAKEDVTELQLLPLGSQVSLNPCGNTVFFSGDTLQSAHITLPGYAVSAEVAYGSIDGSVYYDTKYDGSERTPVSGVNVVATSTKDGVTDTHTTTTDATGKYDFDGLRFADYEIRVDHPNYDSLKGQEYSSGNNFNYQPVVDAGQTPYFSNAGSLVKLTDAEGKQKATNVDVPLWAPHMVTFIADPTRADLSDQHLSSVIAYPVWHNTSVTPPAIHAKDGFVVDTKQWLPVNNETFNFNNVTASGTFKANVVPNNSSYTVNYLEKDTGKVLREPKAGEYKNLGDTVTAVDEQIDIDGYNYDSADKETLTITTGANVINLYYTKRTDLSYTVNYLEKGSTSEVLHEQKVEGNQAFGTVIHASNEIIKIEGYDYDSADNPMLTIGTSENVLNLYYTKKPDRSYTVKYLEADTNKALATAKVVTGKTLGDEVTESAIDIEGYNKVETTSQTIVIAASDNVITFHYKAKTGLSYTVYYRDQATDALLGKKEEKNNQIFGTEVTEEAIDIAGYNKVEPTSQKIIIAVTGNEITFYYTKRTDLSYTVNYLEQGTNTVLATAKVKGGQPFGTVIDYRDEVITINGYAFASTSAAKLTIGTSENVLNLYYTKIDGLFYTVNYLDKQTNEAVQPARVVDKQTFGTEITVANEVINIDGYNYDSADKNELTIGTGENVITLYYNKRTDLSYTVNYLERDTNAVLAEAKTVNGKTYQEDVTESAIDIAGYNKVAPTEAKLTIGTGKNEITFYYTKRNDLSYTVKYVDKETRTEIATAKTVTGKAFQEEVTENAIEIPGYNKVDPVEKKLTITASSEENIITFEYAKMTDLSYTVNYLEKGAGANGADKVLHNPSTFENQTFGNTETVNPISIDGYVTPAPQTITIAASDNVVNFYYVKRADLSYTVKYVDMAGNPLKDADGSDLSETVSNQTFGTVVDRLKHVKLIDSYKFDHAAPDELKLDADDKFLTLYYAKIDGLYYTVQYLESGSNKVLGFKVEDRQTLGTEVTETAIDIEGYNKPAQSSTIFHVGYDGEGKRVDKNVITFYYTKRTDLSYTVKYLEAVTNKVLYPAEADKVVVPDQTFGTTVTVTPVEIEGYVTPDSQHITIAVSGNEVTFYYTKRTDLSYTVNYLEKDTDKVLRNSDVVTGQTFQATVARDAIDITGYSKVEPVSQSITIGVSGNVINFYYTARNDLKYTVKYVEKGTNTELQQANVVENQTFGTTISSADITKADIKGYDFDYATPEKLTIGVDTDANVITLYYTKSSSLSYTVNYLEKDTNAKLAEAKTVDDQTLGKTVTESAIEISGYNKVEPTSTTVAIESEGTVINFYYTKRTDLSYTVKYLEQGTNKPLAAEKAVGNQTFGAEVTSESAIEIEGYTCKEVNPAGAKITIDADLAKNVITFYYTKRTNLSCKVNYLEAKGNPDGSDKVLHDPGTVGSLTFEDTVTVDPIEIPGYTAPASQKIKVAASGNVVNFYYARRTDLSYTVKYVEKDGDGEGKELAKALTVDGQVFGRTVKVDYLGISGYNVDAETKDITIGADSTKNVITFYYTKRSDLDYVVNYLEKDTNKVLHAAKQEGNQTFETEVTEKAIDIAGYNKVEPTESKLIIGTEKNEIIFYYTKRTDLSYTVKYLEEDTDTVLHEEKKVENQTFLKSVTEEAVDIEGYSKADPASQTFIVGQVENGESTEFTESNEVIFYYTPIFCTITFDSNGGSTVASQEVRYNGTVNRPVDPTRSGYTFTGWTVNGVTYDFTRPVTSNITLVANWSANEIPPVIIPTPTPTPTPTPGGTTITDENVPLAGAVGLNDTDHFAYIAGYEDDTVRPTKNITRAEVATIFFRLMTEEFRVANWATENTLKDVLTGDWYNNAVSTCANAGIITGYTDGRFQPQKAITRAEFAVIAARFLGPDANDEGVGDFSDTADHWAAAEIRKAAKAGWITGDGNKFRPNDPITRAEVMVIVNRMLDRTPDAEHMLPDMKTWIDNPEGTWYYEAVQEATNGHDYERDELNVETWTAIQAEKNWKAIEAEWAANNGASASKDDAEPVEADGESK